MLVAELEVLGRQMAKAFGGRTEQQGDRAGSPDVRRQGIVSQATLEERPPIVLIEQVLGFLPRDGGDGELASEPTARGPLQEVSDQVAALAGGSGDPVVDVLLGEVGESQAALVHPGQEVQGDADAASQVAVGGGRMATNCGPLACSPEQEPVQERTGEVGVRSRPVGEFVLQPARDAFEVLVPLVQDAGVDEELADVALIPAGRQLIQQVVGELVPFGRQLSEELGVRALLDPLDGGER
ncbi:hypothetical protein [Streptomyces fulvoviolaceus]|uniref:hypothetical protein n=1 Tax=Streptomyces fulvoviolaceus TaxID=285535 RepID=UPI0021C1233C|nr:hypothetical protein [Streptomyces fulvoviolaceus]MCT9075226.1 hypothetical protein [Streptomyces fulvoviolaceus]